MRGHLFDKEQALKLSKVKQTNSVVKYRKIIEKIDKKDREVLNKLSAKTLNIYAKYKTHCSKLKLARNKSAEYITNKKRGEYIFSTQKSLGGATNVRLRRGAGELIVFTKAKDFIDYVLTATSKSPKEFRFTLVTHIQNYALSMLEDLYKANEVIVIKNDDIKRQQRQAFQRRALTNLSLLCYLCEIAYKHACILEKQYVQIIKQGYEVETYIYNWLNKDQNRYA